MPRTIGANLKTHLAGNTTTVCQLWIITRKDTTVFRFTDHSEDVPYGGDTYQSINSQSLSALEQKTDLSVDQFEFDAILSDADIDRDDVIAGLFDSAEVEVYLINYENVADGVLQMISGTLGNTTVHDTNHATIEFRSLAQQLNQAVGRTYSNECDADLGDARCTVTLATYTGTGTITAVTDNQTFNDSGRSEADDHFNYGLLTWTSGLNNGLTMEVKDWDGGAKLFTLVNPMPFTVQTGDAYSVHQGCNKTKTTCINDFNNVINFRGFAEIPGMDKILQIPDINPNAGLHD
jgi:uncharacterized phage protein (TIGR02218 family)